MISSAERILAKKLAKIGFIVKPFSRRLAIDPRNTIYQQYKSSNYRLDFAIESCRVAIEVDGYWHRLVRQRLSDKDKDKYLRSLSWKVLRLPNENISDDVLQFSILRLLTL